MELTDEQKNIIRYKDDLVINAGAGAAKTTTLLLYAKARPKSKILYLAYNKSIKEEAKKKFAEHGLSNVTIHTAHSLAYKDFSKIKVTNTFSLSELIEICKIKSKSGNKTDEYVLAKLIQDALNIYCNKTDNQLSVNDLALNADKELIDKYYPYIINGVKILTKKMKHGQIPFIHDYYLKLFQLKSNKLPYNYILFDEGQDASPVMLDIFLKQDATKVIVGDSAQAIYGYRLAVNALQSVDFENMMLSKSFRFGQNIASLANNILSWKKLIRKHSNNLVIEGVGGTKSENSTCYISRSNFGVLKSAIVEVEKQKPSSIYFEGGIKGYSFLSNSQSINDLLSLFYRKPQNAKNPMLKSMKSLNEVIQYSERVGDIELSNLAKIVQVYGKDLKHHIKYLYSICAKDKSYADITFSTAHKSKGMEYDRVFLSDDFTTLNKIRIFSEHYLSVSNKDISLEKEREKLNEEINILYVASTRTKNILKKSFD
jgi:F-box protein 18 (helicase)